MREHAVFKPDREQRDYVEKSTVGQADNMLWFEMRTGRITASVAHRAMHTKADNPSTSLIKSICSDKQTLLRVPAILWGRDHEKDAVETFVSHHREQHPNVVVKKAGLRICDTHSYFAASPDGLIVCDICGEGCLEAKCPYRWRDDNVEDMLKDKDCHLDSNGELKPAHEYYAQVQMQMFVTNLNYAQVVTWMNSGCVISYVARNDMFIDDMVSTLSSLWQHAILPELMTRRLEYGQSLSVALNEDDSEMPCQSETPAQLFCYCQQPYDDSVEMIGCDDPACRFKWFHLACAKLKRLPKTSTWFCKQCRTKNKKDKR
jgi:hypothetical protein